jgi:hypothetical protein
VNNEKNKKQRKKELLYALWPRLTTLGFVAKTKEECFWRSFKGGFGSITFKFADNAIRTEVTILAEIRFDELENLKNLGRSDISNNDKLRTFSFTDESGYLLSKSYPQKWIFNDETDLDDLVEEMSDTLQHTMIPYLETYSLMDNALEYMMEYENPNAYTPLETAAINAVGLAYLLKREDLDNIIAAKADMLEQTGTGNLNRFINFVGNIIGVK